MTEPTGYCAEYVVMRFKDDCVHDEDQHHQDQADWLNLQEGKIHAVHTIPKKRTGKQGELLAIKC